MTPGLSFFYGGMVRRRTSISTMLQSFIALGRDQPAVGRRRLQPRLRRQLRRPDRQSAHLLHVPRRRRRDRIRDLSPTIPLLLFALFQLKFAIITPALITGAFAERVRFSRYLLFMSLFSAAHLRAAGALDLASGGLPAAVGRARLRRRHRRAHVGGLRRAGRRDGAGPAAEPSRRRGAHAGQHPVRAARHRHALVRLVRLQRRLGARRLAPPRSLAFATTNTASAAAMLAWIFFDWVRGRKPSAHGRLHRRGGRPRRHHAGGRLRDDRRQHRHRRARERRQQPGRALEVEIAIDDTLDVFPCHGVGGMVGHDPHRRLRQGRRSHQRHAAYFHDAPGRARASSAPSPSSVRGCSTSWWI